MPLPATAVTRVFGMSVPVIQAPMAGGATTPELVAAVSAAGGLGAFAAATLAPAAIRAGVARIRALTDRPFCVNLFVLRPRAPDPAAVERALALLAPLHAELGIAPPAVPARFCEDPDAQFEAVVECAPALASFAFDVLDAAAVERLHRRGCKVAGTATNVAEARAWEAAGADFVCAQGMEAGGHRGTFIGDYAASLIGTMALVPQIVDAVRVPVIAAGGIMDGRGIAAALALGAAAAQMGTAFLDCAESGIHPAWKAALRAAGDTATGVTLAFSGRMARGVVNDYMRRMEAQAHLLPAYPVQNALTGELRAAAGRAGDARFMSLWAGQGVAALRSLPAAALVARLAEETAAARG
ncbi:MAG: nitronate monooxygenase [Burkholderiales bacterium]|nr:nitronate monooxygenase [Burkholderiales bacterium]